MATSADVDDVSTRNDGNCNIPILYLGQHDSTRQQPLGDLAYGHLLNLGVSTKLSMGIKPQASSMFNFLTKTC